ncbi:class I SAM-dependent methyltransferase [Pelomonas sp. Root1237]|uniref:class I SAM-dependent methyltransferase n=1 Tax=Pelomonas sp. Root1237 TaxID=1736434 RepID=UPI000AC09ADD|nr:class I SAM-dependent methyltransferase [Pelomonas sp. Root1237]
MTSNSTHPSNARGLIDRLSTSAYRRSILDGITAALKDSSPVNQALDFGAGDGFFAANLPQLTAIEQVTPIDVVERISSWVKPMLYDGGRLPFDDRSFDLCYAIDVLHHCPDPLAALAEMMRCTRRYLLIKDHNHNGPLGRVVLAVLDELGNRRFGIPSPQHYQQRWAWVDWIESQGFVRRHWSHPMACHRGVLASTNSLQFLGLWARQHD